MDTKLNKRQRWMSAFEDECLKSGVDYEVIHGPGHETFWCSANYYFTHGIAVPDAVRRFREAASHIRGNAA